MLFFPKSDELVEYDDISLLISLITLVLNIEVFQIKFFLKIKSLKKKKKKKKTLYYLWL